METPFKVDSVTPTAYPPTVSASVVLLDDCLPSEETSLGECDQLWGVDISHSGEQLALFELIVRFLHI